MLVVYHMKSRGDKKYSLVLAGEYPLVLTCQGMESRKRVALQEVKATATGVLSARDATTS